MAYSPESEPEPTRDEVDRMAGPVVLEFGAAWCPHCQGLQGDLEEALEPRADVRHIKIEDGKGKPLGRSFRVKLWPTLVFLRDGQVLKQVARPSAEELAEGMGLLGGA